MRKALARATARAATWTEATDVPAVCERAERLLAVHALSAADALQLGAALLLVDDRPRRRSFVVVDSRLSSAAAAEGFTVVRVSD